MYCDKYFTLCILTLLSVKFVESCTCHDNGIDMSGCPRSINMHLFERSMFCCIMANRSSCSVKISKFHISLYNFVCIVNFWVRFLEKVSYICISSQHTGTVIFYTVPDSLYQPCTFLLFPGIKKENVILPIPYESHSRYYSSVKSTKDLYAVKKYFQITWNHFNKSLDFW